MTSEIFENNNLTTVEKDIFDYLEERGGSAKRTDVERRFAEEADYDLSKIREGLEGLEEKGVYSVDLSGDKFYSTSLNELNERAVYDGGSAEDYRDWIEDLEE